MIKWPKKLYSLEEDILQIAIAATTMGVLNILIIKQYFKSEIPNAIVEMKYTNKVSEYISQELKNIGSVIHYKISKNDK